jgi:Meiotically Up-regulated Gene 113 (MUG113) protein
MSDEQRRSGRRPLGERVRGPYRHRRRWWRVEYYAGEGSKPSATIVKTRPEALDLLLKLRKAMSEDPDPEFPAEDPPPPREENALGQIYFVRAGKDGPVKIGFTYGDPVLRVSDLQIGNHLPLILLKSIPGTLADEAAFHRRFARQNLRGEWFDVEGSFYNFLFAIRAVRP